MLGILLFISLFNIVLIQTVQLYVSAAVCATQGVYILLNVYYEYVRCFRSHVLLSIQGLGRGLEINHV